ncbi:acyl-CoA N-acyltransferase [Acephala macrosclerotiorum]|nr:acyl-CoA N-acyltransferase [Acephala macrosclerotiorum]
MPESTSPSPIPKRATLRLAKPEDAPAIAALGSSVFATTFGYSLPPADLDTYLTTSYSIPSITSELKDPAITTLVAVSSSPSPNSPSTNIVGFSQLNRSSTEPAITALSCLKPVELQRLYVDPSFHGGGVGKMLVEAIEGLAKEEGYETLWLGVWEENFKAQGFYGRCGLEKCGFHDFKMGECVQRDWVMRKALL